MPQTIVLNKNNISDLTTNNTLVYKFPNSVQFKNNSIALDSVTMYYSYTNINSSPLGNNTFSYNWKVASTVTSFTVTIPDGLYEISDINSYLQYVFIQNGHYLVDSTSQNVYYAEFLVNPTTYGVNIITYAVPKHYQVDLPLHLVLLVFHQVLLIIQSLPYLQILIILWDILLVLLTTSSGTNSSTSTPQVQPNPTLFLTCSGISNKYASPSTVLYSITPTVALGQVITERPNEKSYAKLVDGTYNQITIKILGTDLNPITILDPAMTIMLSIRDDNDPKMLY